MILKDTETIKNHVPINGTFDYKNILPYSKRAERSFLKPIIGKAQCKIFELESTDEIVLEAKDLAEEVIANYACYLYLPMGVLQITNAGISVAESTHATSASDKQYKELQRFFLKSSHEALDELLVVMEESADKFTDWFNSEYATVYKQFLVNKTATFNKYYYIFNSRQTFVALKPNLQIVEDRFIKPAIGKDLLEALKSNQSIEVRKEVKEAVQKAIVAFTVMLTVDNGMFVMDAQGMHMRFDVLPYEKTVTNINLKVNEFLVRTKANKQIAGEEYLKEALGLITENSDSFEEYEVKEASADLNIVKTKSITGML